MRAVIMDCTDSAKRFRMGAMGDGSTLPSTRVTSKLELFLDLGTSLQLSQDEERTLLDITIGDMIRLRVDNSLAAGFGSKLERRR